MAEYPGVRLGQRGGLFDLYQYYLGGGDEQTDAPVSTVNTTQFIQPVSGGQGEGQVGGGYVPEYLPRDAQGFQIQPESPGSGIFSSQYRPDNFGVDRNIATFGAAGKPIMSGYIEEDEEPNLLDRTKSFFDNSGIGSFVRTVGGVIGGPLMSGASYLSRLGRPADAIYSYGGDTKGVGSRAALTQEEVRNMEFLEKMGGVDEYGKDKYGINTVSYSGDYTAYNEKRVGELKNIVADQEARGLEDTIQMQELKDRTGLQTSIEADEEETAAEIAAKNKMTLDNAVFKTKTAIDTYKEQLGATDDAGITSTITTPSGDGQITDRNRGQTNVAPAQAPSYSQPSGGGGQGLSSVGGSANAGSFSSNSPGNVSQQTSRDARGGMSGWGWKDGGLVTRKPYGDGGIVDLL